MHPDVPTWARRILEREVTSLAFSSFHVLKDATMQKLAVGRTPTGEAVIVQRTPAGGEIYRLESMPLDGAGEADVPLKPEAAPVVTCATCSTVFRYWRANGGANGGVYCFNCGDAVAEVAPSRNGGKSPAPSTK